MKISWNKDNSESQTYSNKHLVNSFKVKLIDYNEDVNYNERLQMVECKYCYYINDSRIGGQAFTDSDCRMCDTTMTFPSTNTDRLCKKCAAENNMCCYCGAEMD